MSQFVNQTEANIIAAHFAGGGGFAAGQFDTVLNFDARFDSITAVSALLSLSPNEFSSIEFSAHSNFRANFIFDGEPNPVEFDAETFAGSGAFTANFGARQFFVGVFDGVARFDANFSIRQTITDRLQIFLDLYPATLNNAGRFRSYTARLRSGNTEIPISSFKYSAPAGAVGSSLSVRLQKPLTGQISQLASLVFEIGVCPNAGGAPQWIPLFDASRFDGSNYQIQAGGGGDSLSLTIVSRLSDRLDLAPPRPLVLYDPLLQTEIAEFEETNGLTRYENGDFVVPQRVAVNNLTLGTVFEQAYVTGCGFRAVKSNLPIETQVSRADFTFDGGFHGGVAPLIGMFEPLIFVIGETLWIIDPTAPLPNGFTPRTITADDYETLSVSAPGGATPDGFDVLLQATGGDFTTTRMHQPSPVSNGNYGTPGYTRTEITNYYKQYRNNDNPTVVLREVLERVETRTYSNTELVAEEFETTDYDLTGKITGGTLRTRGLAPDLTGTGMSVQTLFEKRFFHRYKPDPRNNRNMVLDRIETQTSGLILVDNDNTYLDQPFKTVYSEAHRGGLIDRSINQTLEYGPISSRIEEYVSDPSGQVTVRTRERDVLRNTVHRSDSQTKPGEVALRAPGARPAHVIVTLNPDGRTAQRIRSFAVGELPRSVALALARRKLQRLNSRKRRLAVNLPVLDFVLRRGSVRRVTDRNGASLGDYLVEGFEIEGDLLGQPGQIFKQSFEGAEL